MNVTIFEVINSDTLTSFDLALGNKQKQKPETQLSFMVQNVKLNMRQSMNAIQNLFLYLSWEMLSLVCSVLFYQPHAVDQSYMEKNNGKIPQISTFNGRMINASETSAVAKSLHSFCIVPAC